MFNKDIEDEFDAKLNMTEYLASFINNEAVRQIRDSRENRKVISDDQLEKILREQFGRDLSPEVEQTAVRADVPIEEPVIEKKKTKGTINVEDIKKYLQLDDVKYIPNKK